MRAVSRGSRAVAFEVHPAGVKTKLHVLLLFSTTEFPTSEAEERLDPDGGEASILLYGE